MIVGGLMARLWLLLRPVEDLPPRTTNDVDLGIDRRGLRLTATATLIKPLLEARRYTAGPGDEAFRFEKRFGPTETFPVDVLIAKGASRSDPPMLEKGVPTLAAPGLAYALSRGAVLVDVAFVDGSATTTVELPLPTLDAAFVLKGALVASGVRMRPDRRQLDRVDAIMLAAACLQDANALEDLVRARGGERRHALTWLARVCGHPESGAAQAVGRYLSDGTACLAAPTGRSRLPRG